MGSREDKIQLPLFEDHQLLPTGKVHVSYSELFEHLECSYKHKLKHIDKIDLDHQSIHTEYGHVIHDVLQEYILHRKPITKEVTTAAQVKFVELCKDVEQYIPPEKLFEFFDDVKKFTEQMPLILEAVPDWMNDMFPGWQPVAAEFPLFEKINEQKDPRYFKGFIDAVIRVPVLKKRSKRTIEVEELPEGEDREFDIVILDWKTTKEGWHPEQKKDFNKQLQLMLYKHFWCEKFELPLDAVKCGFVFLKREPKENDPRIEFMPVSVGPKTREKSVETMNTMIRMVKARRSMKNRWSCRFCPYSGTKHCI